MGGAIAASAIWIFPTKGAPSGQCTFFDATQVVHANRGGIELETAKYASLQLDTAGDSPQTAATPLISLWQMNIVGIKAVRRWDVQRVRDTAVAVTSSVSYTGNSPN